MLFCQKFRAEPAQLYIACLSYENIRAYQLLGVQKTSYFTQGEVIEFVVCVLTINEAMSLKGDVFFPCCETKV
jgi:hypothetical protein